LEIGTSRSEYSIPCPDHPQEDLANFGSRSERTLENFRINNTVPGSITPCQDLPQEDLAKFGYRSERTLEKIRVNNNVPGKSTIRLSKFWLQVREDIRNI
jgi:hypothetical protein